MKRNYKSIFSMGVALFLSTAAMAQAINEGFTDVTTLPAAGWAQQNLSTTQGTNPNWGQGNASVFPANSNPTTSFVASNFNAVTGAGTISNWLFAPERTITNGDVFKFYTRTAGSYADNLQVRMSLNGASVNAGASDTSVGDFTTLLLEINPTLVVANYPTVWTQYTITISGLSAPTNGRIAFRYYVTDGGPSGNNSNYIGIDDFEYIPFGAPVVPDVVVNTPLMHQYTVVPVSQVTPIALGATIKNVGTAATSDASMKVNVYESGNPTPVYTETSTPATLASGASSAINFTSFTPPSAAMDYLIEYISSCTNNDNVNASDTTGVIFIVDDSIYARDYAHIDGVAGSLGIGAGGGQNSRLGQTFELIAADTLTSVDIFISNNTDQLVGQPLIVHIYDAPAGVPTTLLGSTDAITMDTTSNKLWNLNITGGLPLPIGKFAVAVEENDSNITVGNTPKVFTTNSIFVKWNNNASGAWTTVETFGANFSKPFVIRPVFGTVPAGVGINNVSTTEFSIYPNPAINQISVNNAKIGSTIEIVNSLGQSVFSSIINNNTYKVNVANYENGLYLVKVTNHEETITNSFVKQ